MINRLEVMCGVTLSWSTASTKVVVSLSAVASLNLIATPCLMIAGLLSSGYQLLTLQPASFRVLHEGERNKALAAIPFLLFAAPFIIIRNTVRGARIGGRNFGAAMMAALVAGFWSLLSGTVVVMALEAVGRVIA